MGGCCGAMKSSHKSMPAKDKQPRSKNNTLTRNNKKAEANGKAVNESQEAKAEVVQQETSVGEVKLINPFEVIGGTGDASLVNGSTVESKNSEEESIQNKAEGESELIAKVVSIVEETIRKSIHEECFGAPPACDGLTQEVAAKIKVIESEVQNEVENEMSNTEIQQEEVKPAMQETNVVGVSYVSSVPEQVDAEIQHVEVERVEVTHLSAPVMESKQVEVEVEQKPKDTEVVEPIVEVEKTNVVDSTKIQKMEVCLQQQPTGAVLEPAKEAADQEEQQQKEALQEEVKSAEQVIEPGNVKCHEHKPIEVKEVLPEPMQCVVEESHLDETVTFDNLQQCSFASNFEEQAPKEPSETIRSVPQTPVPEIALQEKKADVEQNVEPECLSAKLEQAPAEISIPECVNAVSQSVSHKTDESSTTQLNLETIEMKAGTPQTCSEASDVEVVVKQSIEVSNNKVVEQSLPVEVAKQPSQSIEVVEQPPQMVEISSNEVVEQNQSIEVVEQPLQTVEVSSNKVVEHPVEVAKQPSQSIEVVEQPPQMVEISSNEVVEHPVEVVTEQPSVSIGVINNEVSAKQCAQPVENSNAVATIQQAVHPIETVNEVVPESTSQPIEEPSQPASEMSAEVHVEASKNEVVSHQEGLEQLSMESVEKVETSQVSAEASQKQTEPAQVSVEVLQTNMEHVQTCPVTQEKQVITEESKQCKETIDQQILPKIEAIPKEIEQFSNQLLQEAVENVLNGLSSVAAEKESKPAEVFIASEMDTKSEEVSKEFRDSTQQACQCQSEIVQEEVKLAFEVPVTLTQDKKPKNVVIQESDDGETLPPPPAPEELMLSQSVLQSQESLPSSQDSLSLPSPPEDLHCNGTRQPLVENHCASEVPTVQHVTLPSADSELSSQCTTNAKEINVETPVHEDAPSVSNEFQAKKD